MEELDVTLPPHGLPGVLALPAGAAGVVLIAHQGCHEHRHPVCQRLARALAAAGLASLRGDLLTTEEALDERNARDLPLLATRLKEAAQWLAEQDSTRPLTLGCLGTGAGAGAALLTAADGALRAVVVCGPVAEPAGDAALAAGVPVLRLPLDLPDDALRSASAWLRRQLG